MTTPDPEFHMPAEAPALRTEPPAAAGRPARAGPARPCRYHSAGRW
jgi:hypothetical protein